MESMRSDREKLLHLRNAYEAVMGSGPSDGAAQSVGGPNGKTSYSSGYVSNSFQETGRDRARNLPQPHAGLLRPREQRG